jgi:thiamine-phosphate pyrophosphorylase
MCFMPGDPNVLRLLDANLNRAREGLRVLEDYARFVRDDLALSERLKTVRHRLAAATRAIDAQTIAHRDTPGDVGTSYAINAALPRRELADVVTAAGKRVGEALRSVEEYLKTIDPAAAREVEGVRYLHYGIEQFIARSFGPKDARLAKMRLYVIVTEAHCGGRPWLDVVRAAIAGGADAIQLREKDLDAGDLVFRARQLVSVCRQHDVISIINDRADIALITDADGVHVGQGDLSARDARKLMGEKKIVGVSTHSIADARTAVSDSADYLGVGPVFPSATKPRDIAPGLAYAREVAAEIRIPAVAIAGITLENVAQVVVTGMKSIAVTSAVCAAPDVEAAARALKASIPL